MTSAPVHAAPRGQMWPLYAAGFTTAFGAHGIAANLGGLSGHSHLAAGARRAAGAVRRCRGAAQTGVRHARRPDRRSPGAAGRPGRVRRRVRRCTPWRTARAGCGRPDWARAPRPPPSPRRPRRWSPGSTRRQTRAGLRQLRLLQVHRLHPGPLLGGVLVWAGGLRLLFAVLAVLGAAVAGVGRSRRAARAAAAPGPADRTGPGPAAGRRAFLRPTAALAASHRGPVGRGGLPAGVGRGGGPGHGGDRRGRVGAGRLRGRGPAPGRASPGRRAPDPRLRLAAGLLVAAAGLACAMLPGPRRRAAGGRR